jgi:hypothetical protein
MFAPINEVAVLVSAILAVAVESIWYSPLLFGTVWKKSASLVSYVEDVSSLHMVRTTILQVLLYGVFYSAVVFILDAWSETHTFIDGVTLVYMCIFVFLGSVALREHRAYSYMLVHGGYTAIMLCGGVSIIMYWPW